ncbi:MAG: ATP-binding protein [Desulfobulbaceae bacterium]|nr:ATP-binding protein [Desulfobulbaceae bacterium]
MKFLPYLPLQWKFITITSVAILFFTTVFGSLAASRNRAVLHDATEKQGKVLAQTVAALIINELIYEKLGLVEEGGLIDNYLQELFKRRELDYLYLAVLDENNRVISHSDFREYGKVYSDKVLVFPQGTEVAVRAIELDGARDNALEFAAPLSIGGKNWGVFLFAVNLRHVNEEVRHMLFEIWSFALVTIGSGFVLIFFLSRRFIRPITTLAAVMREVDANKPQQYLAPVTGNDELAQLAGDFNAMVNRLSRANDEMKKAHEKLLQSEKLATLGILSSSVAHRINNPLGGLKNCIAMLMRNGEDPVFRRNYLDLMQEGVDSIEQTVAQLLWTAGKRRGEETRANIVDALAAVMRFIDYRIRKTEISFVADVPDRLFAAVSPHDLNQILVNLLINAIQAMPAGGRLTVGARREGAEVAITVSDTGVGIPESETSKIFDLFYSSKKPEEGTGLGLWMTYELVKRNKGDIHVDSRVGEGTTFTVIFQETP